MKPYYEYRQCLKCEYIEDCPHPFVDQDGSPHPPRECSKPEEIKLTKRIHDIEPRE